MNIIIAYLVWNLIIFVSSVQEIHQWFKVYLYVKHVCQDIKWKMEVVLLLLVVNPNIGMVLSVSIVMLQWRTVWVVCKYKVLVKHTVLIVEIENKWMMELVLSADGITTWIVDLKIVYHVMPHILIARNVPLLFVLSVSGP